ncbi:MAG TPA: ABC transporter ATP-binding protein [candidate division Zixibacteria bacterium]|nr:ABC transporter ATP-binding protein [candidate division Zixibacteria bacterium]MDD4917531.1 ABC transporter ATP-binding protein [candidate division Zixibacteria bacterium]MDM7972200.1 ABC transporter ATP-binding protein [candidate division Zixibacteria bacterium]HOZ06788.1 ABC transporter ATP-binding protein [candidate division Zixibacteria bacterium]HPM36539.1 ABC transporter ATP-binding protein [candidate division Zixibacteria bacterium]
MAFLEVQGLARSYRGVRAVEDFSFAMERGEIYALVGPDGAGKTTVIRAIANLITPDRGRILLDGTDIRDRFDRVKSRLGYMPQVFSLYPDLSVEENLIFYAGVYGVTGRAYEERRDRMYDFSNLRPFAGRRAAALSGGMKQKLALSCALMHDPELLLLDEPTTGVDPLSRRQFWDILLQLKRDGAAVLVTTPYMDEVARADRGSFVFGGRKLAEGSPRELTESFSGEVYFVGAAADLELVRRLNELPEVSAQRFGAGLHLYLPRGGRLEPHLPALAACGIRPEQIRKIRPDLEDAFIQLMERSA